MTRALRRSDKLTSAQLQCLLNLPGRREERQLLYFLVNWNQRIALERAYVFTAVVLLEPRLLNHRVLKNLRNLSHSADVTIE